MRVKPRTFHNFTGGGAGTEQGQAGRRLPRRNLFPAGSTRLTGNA